MTNDTGAKSEPLVVGIILNWNGIAMTANGKPILETCLSSLMKTRYPNLKVIVVDAESQDDSISYVKKNYGEVDLMSVENKGWVYGNNRGIELAYKKYPEVKYITLLNDDLDFNDPDWLAKMISVAEEDNKRGTINCKILKPTGGIDYCGAHIGPLGTLKVESDADTPRNVEIIGGPAMIITREAFDKIGLLDEIYLPFYGGDDADLSLRVIKAGYTNYYTPNATITHIGELSTYGNQKIKRTFTKQEIAYSTVRGVYIFLMRYYPWRIPGYLLFCIGRAFITTRPKLKLRPAADIAMMLPMPFTGLAEAISLRNIKKIPFPK